MRTATYNLNVIPSDWMVYAVIKLNFWELTLYCLENKLRVVDLSYLFPGLFFANQTTSGFRTASGA